MMRDNGGIGIFGYSTDLLRKLAPIVSHRNPNILRGGKMERRKITSSCINSFGYDDKKHTLEIEYSHGDNYDYEKVPPEVIQEFLRADSKGKFVNKRMEKFPFRKVSSRPFPTD